MMTYSASSSAHFCVSQVNNDLWSQSCDFLYHDDGGPEDLGRAESNGFHL